MCLIENNCNTEEMRLKNMEEMRLVSKKIIVRAWNLLISQSQKANIIKKNLSNVPINIYALIE